ncbi:MAG: hypothetical protein Q9P14_11995 [candidate division KSB1 bacterium]|nr:hypothetical protein [candidate division KSB1 bacterium]
MSNFENDPQFEQLKSRLQQNPDSLIFARVAEGLLNRGQVEEAIRISEEGIRKHPYYITGHMVLGKCYLQKKLFDLAEKEFKRVLLFDPKYIAAHKFYGDLMREVGWENTCEMSYRKILQIDPLDRTAREMLETLEKVRPRETEIVTPEKDTDAEVGPNAAPSDAADTATGTFDTDLAAVESAAAAQSSEAEPINLDDDLFAEVKSEIETPPPQTEGETTNESAIDETDVSGILEDIFEEEPPKEQEPHLEEFSLKSVEQQSESPIVTEEQPTPQPVDESETPPLVEEKAADEDPLKALDQFEEETLEIEQFDQFREDMAAQQESTDQDEQDLATQEFLESATAQEEPEEQAQDLFATLDSLSTDNQASSETDETDWDQSLAADHLSRPETGVGESAGLPESAETTSPTSGDYELPPTSLLQESESEPAAPEPRPSAGEPAAADAQAPQDTADATAVSESAPPPEPTSQPATEPESGAANSRERIVTPTLGEIYAAQGQFAKAINVFEMLLKKDPNNAAYKEKIEMLKKRLEENQNGG